MREAEGFRKRRAIAMALGIFVGSGTLACTLANGNVPEPAHVTQPCVALADSLPEWHTVDLELVNSATRPYESEEVFPVDGSPTDEEGLLLWESDGRRYHHPVAVAQYALKMLNSYRVTSDAKYLAAAEVNAENLLAEATVNRNGDRMWFPYPFDFPLHGDPTNTIESPWYSAMAQGQALSLLVRLHEATGDSRWIEAADAVFSALALVLEESAVPRSQAWVSFVDDSGWLWLEEYAGNVQPMKVLNGHIFAMFGLHDYSVARNCVSAELLFEGAAATVLRYVPELRNDGEPSWYGIRVRDNPAAKSAKYHQIHIGQLTQLTELTSHPAFVQYAELLESDYSSRG